MEGLGHQTPIDGNWVYHPTDGSWAPKCTSALPRDGWNEGSCLGVFGSTSLDALLVLRFPISSQLCLNPDSYRFTAKSGKLSPPLCQCIVLAGGFAELPDGNKMLLNRF